ncbi:glycosyltransferase family 4 protein [Halorussus salilacus]|uniref:glycosyltransferase family 4 protein n=1 Tax=Halorussus salilacus TaxID=2953750 RepID=UPI00209CE329|nr:glycosyltransferase family 4 protein [Halorussus salilacus]USZ67399.1 glycosyltransferase family 4 protein [Halorussus salilacus]
MTGKTIQFYAQVGDESLLEQTSYYKFDIEVLREIADEHDCELRIGTSPKDLLSSADLYFAWWGTTGITPVIRSKLAQSPSIVVAGGSEVVSSLPEDLPIMYSSKPLWQKLVIRTCVNAASVTITPSQHMAEEARSLGVNDPKVVPNCIDTSVYTPKEPDPAYLPYEPDEYYLTIAKYAPSSLSRKELFTLLDGLKQVDTDLPLVFAGGLVSEEVYDRVTGYAEQIGVSDRVTFLTDISKRQKIELLRGARLYLQPTLHEAFGVALTEAMACETPVVSTRRGAVPEVVDDTGYFAAVGDSTDLASTIGTASVDPERTEKAVAARERVVEKFSLSVRKEELSKLVTTYL